MRSFQILLLLLGGTSAGVAQVPEHLTAVLGCYVLRWQDSLGQHPTFPDSVALDSMPSVGNPPGLLTLRVASSQHDLWGIPFWAIRSDSLFISYDQVVGGVTLIATPTDFGFAGTMFQWAELTSYNERVPTWPVRGIRISCPPSLAAS